MGNINLKQTSFAGILSALADVNVPAPNDQDTLIWDTATSKWIAQAAAATFLALTDTPANYAGSAGKVVVVNAIPDALEFVDILTLAGLTVTDIFIEDHAVDFNLRLGYGAGTSIQAGGQYNILLGQGAGDALTTGDFNIAMGYMAFYYSTVGAHNVAIGYEALKGTLGQTASAGNFALGYGALRTCYGASNVAVGMDAGRNITSGGFNMLIGSSAGKMLGAGIRNVAIGAGAMSLGTGTENIAIGFECGKVLAGGQRNSFIGTLAGWSTTSGSYNVAIGRYTHLFNKTGINNTVLGASAGQGAPNKSNSNNTFVGFEAAKAIDIGGNNVCIGYQSGKSITTGTGNVVIGYMAAEGQLTVGNNQLWIANSNIATPLIYGEFDNALVKIYDFLFLPNIKSGANQAGAGAAAGELWKTNGHATLLDNIVMIGV